MVGAAVPMTALFSGPPLSTNRTWVVPGEGEASSTTLGPETVALFDGTSTVVVGACAEAGSTPPTTWLAATIANTAMTPAAPRRREIFPAPPRLVTSDRLINSDLPTPEPLRDRSDRSAQRFVRPFWRHSTWADSTSRRLLLQRGAGEMCRSSGTRWGF